MKERGGICLKSKASISMSLDLFSINMWPHRGNKKHGTSFWQCLHCFSVFFSKLVGTFPAMHIPSSGAISSAAQSLLCTSERKILISPTESDETGFWFFQESVWSSFQNSCGGGSRVTHELLYSMAYWQICNYFMQTEVCSPTSISCSNDPESIT